MRDRGRRHEHEPLYPGSASRLNNLARTEDIDPLVVLPRPGDVDTRSGMDDRRTPGEGLLEAFDGAGHIRPPPLCTRAPKGLRHNPPLDSDHRVTAGKECPGSRATYDPRGSRDGDPFSHRCDPRRGTPPLRGRYANDRPSSDDGHRPAAHAW